MEVETTKVLNNEISKKRESEIAKQRDRTDGQNNETAKQRKSEIAKQRDGERTKASSPRLRRERGQR